MRKTLFKKNAGADALDGYTVFFDGCCEPRNPGGTAGYGAIIYKGDKEVWRHAGMLPASPTNSNNVAEYVALNAALDWLLTNGLSDQPIVADLKRRIPILKRLIADCDRLAADLDQEVRNVEHQPESTTRQVPLIQCMPRRPLPGVTT